MTWTSDPPPDFSVPLVPALSEAETIASQILGGSLALSCKSVERLADLLLAEALDSDGRFSQGRSVSAGLYHRHKLGLRRLCTSHPQSVRALNSFVTFLAPDHFYSSLVLIDGIASVAHCDVANAALPNLVIPVTSSSGESCELRIPRAPIFCIMRVVLTLPLPSRCREALCSSRPPLVCMKSSRLWVVGWC